MEITESLKENLIKLVNSPCEEDHIILIHLLDKTKSAECKKFMKEAYNFDRVDNECILRMGGEVDFPGYRYYIGKYIWFYNGAYIFKENKKTLEDWLSHSRSNTKIIEI